jgi:hypothetical protein
VVHRRQIEAFRPSSSSSHTSANPQSNAARGHIPASAFGGSQSPEYYRRHAEEEAEDSADEDFEEGLEVGSKFG